MTVTKFRFSIMRSFLLFFLTVLQNVDTTCDQKSVQWKSRSYYCPKFYRGEWVVFDCRVKNNFTNVSLWHINSYGNGKQRIADGKKIIMLANQKFNLTNLSSSDEGDYQCRACNEINRITFIQMDDDDRGFQSPIITNRIYGRITLGTNIRLDCEIYGRYEIGWYKAEKPLSTRKEVDELASKRVAVLTIESFTGRNDGFYSCKAKRQIVHWIGEEKIYLQATEVKPIINRKIFKSKVNDSQELKCNVSQSNPIPEWKWFECVDDLYNCSTSFLGWFGIKKETSRESTLVITKQEFQRMSYRCIARNKLGENYSSICHIFRQNGIRHMRAMIKKVPLYETAGANLTIMCQCNGSVNMEWFRDGHKILTSIDATSFVGTIDITRKIVQIENFTKNDEGIYECRLKYRKYNWTHVNRVKLSMKVAPKIKAAEITSKYTFCKGLQLECNIVERGIPRANLSWERCICDVTCSECTQWLKLQNATTIRTVGHQSTLTIYSQTSQVVNYRCKVENIVGKDGREWIVRKVMTFKHSGKYMAAIVSVTIAMFVVLLIFVVVLYRRKKLYGKFYIFTHPPLLDYIEKINSEKLLVEQTNKLPYLSEWEFPRERINIERTIGHGAFGQVCFAKVVGISAFNPRRTLEEKSKQWRFSIILNRKRNSYLSCSNITEAAVKMLNENWNESDLNDLLSELKILIHIGEHKNVVNILAACTKGQRSETWIIMEYCPYGNMSEFLRNRREIYKPEWLQLMSHHDSKLSITDLVETASQIASGMEFLISRKCIHRDLAARNILIGHNYVPKIADFGLARNIYKDEFYLKKKPGLVPVKWMSIEAIRDRMFSEKSDVWSFGVLLWEMFTLGGSPYPGIHSVDVYEYLCSGNRMKPPVLCPNKIYDLMMACWNADPHQRPEFKMIRESLIKMLFDKEQSCLVPLEIDENENGNRADGTGCRLLGKNNEIL